MNHRTQEIRRLAPVSFFLTMPLFLAWVLALAAALVKWTDVLQFGADLHLLLGIAGIAFIMWAIVRIRLSIVNDELEQKLIDAP